MKKTSAATKFAVIIHVIVCLSIVLGFALIDLWLFMGKTWIDSLFGSISVLLLVCSPVGLLQALLFSIVGQVDNSNGKGVLCASIIFFVLAGLITAWLIASGHYMFFLNIIFAHVPPLALPPAA